MFLRKVDWQTALNGAPPNVTHCCVRKRGAFVVCGSSPSREGAAFRIDVPMGCGARSCQTDGVKGFPTLRGSLLRGQSSCCARPTYDKQARCARCIRSGPLFALLASFFSLSDRLLVVRPKTRDQRREEVPMPCYWCAAREVYPFSPPQKRGAAVAEIRSWKVDDSQSREKNLGQEPFVAPFRRRRRR